MNSGSTIFALSSGAGMAGIAVIRLSGPASRKALQALTGIVSEPRHIVVADIRHPLSGELIDKGLVLFFAAPASATGEDVGELHVHGGPAVVSGVLEALSQLPGLVPAEAGEFTRRAFRNGKIDLVEAEGLADLLSAEGDVQRRQALFHMSGGASKTVEAWFDETMAILARLEGAIDFIDEADVARSALRGVRPRIMALVGELQLALGKAERAGAVRDGVRIAIVGPPNVGKSSLLNALAARDAAIVSPIAGTTRDVIEVRVVLAGLPVVVSDTAGLRSGSSDEIEQLGMGRALQAAKAAHLVLRVESPDVVGEEIAVAETGAVLRVLNKADLLHLDSIHSRNENLLLVSTRTGQGIQNLLRMVEDKVRAEYSTQDNPVLVRERHRVAVSGSIRLLNDSLGFGPDRIEFAAEAVRGAAHSLARLTGRVDVEDLLGRIFAEFCVGK